MIRIIPPRTDNSKPLRSGGWRPYDADFASVSSWLHSSPCSDEPNIEIIAVLKGAPKLELEQREFPRSKVFACFCRMPFSRMQGWVGRPGVKYAPKWFERPVGATFGFGGRVVSFEPKKTTARVPLPKRQRALAIEDFSVVCCV